MKLKLEVNLNQGFWFRSISIWNNSKPIASIQKAIIISDLVLPGLEKRTSPENILWAIPI
jgi:hypothetical protein